jgi:hypothetical protein
VGIVTTAELNAFLKDKWCGCGAPWEATKYLMDVLHMFRPDEGEDKRFCDARYASRKEFFKGNDGLQFFVLYTVDNWGLLEHGGGVGGSWFTQKGQEVYDALKKEWARGDNFETLHEMVCPCGSDWADPVEEHLDDCKAVR